MYTNTAFKGSTSPYMLCEDISYHLPVCTVLKIKQFQKSLKCSYAIFLKKKLTYFWTVFTTTSLFWKCKATNTTLIDLLQW